MSRLVVRPPVGHASHDGVFYGMHSMPDKCHRRPRGLVWLLLVGLSGLGSAGCQSLPWTWENPLRRTPAPLTSETSLAARIARVQEETKGLQYLSEAEQMQVSTRLAQTLSKEPHPAVRREIAKSLGAFRTPAALEGLRGGLQDADREVRIAACESLAQWDSPQAWQMLEAALHSDTDVDVRLAATRCLGRSQDASARESLARALDDADPAVQYLAMQSLQQSTGRKVGNDVKEWKRIAREFTPRGESSPAMTEGAAAWR